MFYISYYGICLCYYSHFSHLSVLLCCTDDDLIMSYTSVLIITLVICSVLLSGGSEMCIILLHPSPPSSPPPPPPTHTVNGELPPSPVTDICAVTTQVSRLTKLANLAIIAVILTSYHPYGNHACCAVRTDPPRPRQSRAGCSQAQVVATGPGCSHRLML